MASPNPRPAKLLYSQPKTVTHTQKTEIHHHHQVPKKNPVWVLDSLAIKLRYRMDCLIASAFVGLWPLLDRRQTTAEIKRSTRWSVCMSWKVIT